VSREPKQCCDPKSPACDRCGCRVCGNKDGSYGCRPTRCGASFAPDGSALAWPGYLPEGLRVVPPVELGEAIAKARLGHRSFTKIVCDELQRRLEAESEKTEGSR
jgi:hypothetical protein